jgi:hypothetical protein
MINLFGETDEVIRTLGFYQPFGTLMLNGKVETRWARVNRKLSFPIGKYLLYTTKKSCTYGQFIEWSGIHTINRVKALIWDDPTKDLNGYAIAIGELKTIREMRLEDEENCFVHYKGTEYRNDKNNIQHEYHQFCLQFENIQRIKPFEFKFGKQGVGILPQSEIYKINLADKK